MTAAPRCACAPDSTCFEHMCSACQEAPCPGCATKDAEIERLREALREVLMLINSGYFVRDISHDGEPGWAMKQIPALMTLQKAARAVVGEVKP